ncbi:unnamed protein product, partial [Allacma fusca]
NNNPGDTCEWRCVNIQLCNSTVLKQFFLLISCSDFNAGTNTARFPAIMYKKSFVFTRGEAKLSSFQWISCCWVACSA